MKRFLLGLLIAISIPVFAASLWPSGPWLETFQNGFLFGNGSILSALNNVPTFNDNRLDDRNKDIFFQEDFEGASVGFTCGANIVASDDTVAPLSQLRSKVFTQSTGALGQSCESSPINLDPKQYGESGKDKTISLCISKSLSNNFSFVVIDKSNSDAEMGRVSANQGKDEYCVFFNVGDTTFQIAYKIEVTTELNADEIKIDDITISSDPFALADTDKIVVKNRSDSSDVENTFSARIANNGTASVTSENVDWIESVTRNSAGVVQINFKTGVFSQTPSIVASPIDLGSSATYANIDAISTTQAIVQVNNTALGGVDRDFEITLVRQGTDYIKETDKVYTVPIGFKESEFFLANNQNNFWSSATDTFLIDESLIQPAISTSKYLEIDSATDPTQDRFVNKTDGYLDISVTIGGRTDLDGSVLINDSSFRQIGGRQQQPDAGRDASHSATFKLAPSDFFVVRNTDPRSDGVGAISVWVKPAKEEGVYLGTFGQPTCYVKDVKPFNLDGGTPIVGTQVRDLNTIEGDCSFLSLSLNQISINETGNYTFECSSPCYRCNQNKIYIGKDSGATRLIEGDANFFESGNFIAGKASLMGAVRLSSLETIELYHSITNASATGNGLGVRQNDSSSNTYSQCKITKVR